MASLKGEIKSLLYSVNIYNRVQEIERNVSQEKVKTIELMAIFTAILALIFANVQFFAELKLNEILVANGSLVLALTWMIWISQRVALSLPILPIPNWGRFLKWLLSTAFTILILIVTLYLGASLVRWLI